MFWRVWLLAALFVVLMMFYFVVGWLCVAGVAVWRLVSLVGLVDLCGVLVL